MSKEKKRKPGRDEGDVNRSIDKRKGVEKLWRKGTSKWKYDGDTESENQNVDRRRGAPRKHAIAIDGKELEGQISQTGGPQAVVIGMNAEGEFRAKPRRSTTTENKNSTLIVVGDRVRFIIADDESAVITHVYARDTLLARRSIESSGIEQAIIANLDQVGIVVAASHTMLKPGLIDRYIIAAAMGGIASFICVNKMDLVDDESKELIDDIREVYEHAGYKVLYTSCLSGEGMDELLEHLRGKLTVFSGHSGVGKTSILNEVIPDLEARTQELSDQSQRGIHTTTKSTLYTLPGGGAIADTPGIREFGLYHFNAEDLHSYYPEFLQFSASCKFSHCTHVHEPDCEVKAAVEREEISDLRYDNYLQILDSEGEYERKW
jgi:ribosome biogenesis GTPase / thiamine phosphate phosphatase